MKLNVLERLILLRDLPQKGNLATLKLVREMRETLSMNDKEIEKYEIKVDTKTGSFNWNLKKGNEEVEIDISEFGINLIKDTLKELDKNEKLVEREHFSLCEKFLEDN